MTAPSQEKVLFNTPEASSAAAGSGKARHTFDVTPPMSSYLVAFVVGNLTSVSSTVPYPHGTQADRLISVWGTPDRCHPTGSLNLYCGFECTLLLRGGKGSHAMQGLVICFSSTSLTAAVPNTLCCGRGPFLRL